MEFVASALALFSAGSSLLGGISGGKSASAAGKQEARAEQVVTSAKLTDLLKEEEVLRGQTIATAAGSGVKTDVGSPLTILAEQAKSFARERLTVAKVGASRAAQSTTRARMAGQQAMYQGIGGAASSASSAFSMMPKHFGKKKGKG